MTYSCYSSLQFAQWIYCCQLDVEQEIVKISGITITLEALVKLQEVQTTHWVNIVGMNTRKLFVRSDDGFYKNLMQIIHLNTNVLNPVMDF